MSDPEESFSQAARGKQRSMLAELAHFIAHNKKWWLTPLIVILLVISLLVLLGGSAAAPFIYTLF